MGGKKAADQFDPRRWAGRRFFDVDDIAEATGNAASSRRSSLQVRALRELARFVDDRANSSVGSQLLSAQPLAAEGASPPALELRQTRILVGTSINGASAAPTDDTESEATVMVSSA